MMVTDRQIQLYVIDVGFQSAILTMEGMNEIQDMNVRINYYSMILKCMKRPILTSEQKSGLNSIINSLHTYDRRNIRRTKIS